ncbi:hypothetical protein O7632_30515 [Solwaraspora sp. WMMD406]|uniref:hypothetical protein n=1 Tax=Solwaraspora sp. WMMD406 TaxID=3016095 RepID=UPI002416CC0D|nr:hypothetical protein [Solwaraspora sp. WMMD406]MDG4768394.1 hypothetical protein [Solwaraspora sp. WMMD406]
MRKMILLVTAAVTAVAVATPAAAQPSGDTLVTFTVSTSDLTIQVPAAVNLGSAFPGQTLTGQLGNVTVNDQRAALTATWVASVVSTAFTTGSGGPEETIQPNVVDYWSGPAVSTTGTGTFVPGQPTAADAVSLSMPRTAFSKTAGSGNNSATWNPTLEIAIPGDSVAGLYQGTVTHSVA